MPTTETLVRFNEVLVSLMEFDKQVVLMLALVILVAVIEFVRLWALESRVRKVERFLEAWTQALEDEERGIPTVTPDPPQMLPPEMRPQPGDRVRRDQQGRPNTSP